MKIRDLSISLISGVILAVVLIYYGAIPVSRAQTPVSADSIRPVTDTDTNPFSWQIRELMLNSHHHWETLQADVVTTWYRGGQEDFQVFTHVLIDGSSQVRFETSQSNREEQYIWIMNASGIYESNIGKNLIEESPYSTLDSINRDYNLLPVNIQAVNTNVIYQHPIAARVPSPAASYIYPTAYAQRANGFVLQGEDTVAGRNTWIVEWLEEEPASLKQLFWVDRETGMILKAVSYIGENLDQIYEETVFTRIVLDEPVSPEAFLVDPGY